MRLRELDWIAPADAFAPLSGRADAFLLHAGDDARTARWSFIGAGPSSRIVSIAGRTYRDGLLTDVSPFAALQDLHEERRRQSAVHGHPPLSTGLIGYAGYECARFVEPAFDGPPSPYALPDLAFNAYDAIAAFDREAKRFFVSGLNDEAIDRLVTQLGGAGEIFEEGALSVAAAPKSNFSRSGYEAAIRAVTERIRSGDLFQANISQVFSTPVDRRVDPYACFRGLARSSSAPYAAYLALTGAAILSFSPERFFSITWDESGNRIITAEPIKGTRPRGRTPVEDASALKDLTASMKDRAENIMIADLTRNDLSKICIDHSIREEAICEAVTHSTVHHLVSRISGVLRPGVDPVAALSSMFPCGSITGAPKVEAMKAIAETERIGRGPYCGAIGYIDDGGAADFSVAIRIAVVEGGKASIPVGGGVTLRSDPAAEYAETLDKARWAQGLFRDGLAVRDDPHHR